jgi:hypothetical protein
MELKIQYTYGRWVVVPKEMTMGTDWFFITCDTSEEAMQILQQLNGQPYEVINAFHRARERLS